MLFYTCFNFLTFTLHSSFFTRYKPYRCTFPLTLIATSIYIPTFSCVPTSPPSTSYPPTPPPPQPSLSPPTPPSRTLSPHPTPSPPSKHTQALLPPLPSPRKPTPTLAPTYPRLHPPPEVDFPLLHAKQVADVA